MKKLFQVERTVSKTFIMQVVAETYKEAAEIAIKQKFDTNNFLCGAINQTRLSAKFDLQDGHNAESLHDAARAAIVRIAFFEWQPDGYNEPENNIDLPEVIPVIWKGQEWYADFACLKEPDQCDPDLGEDDRTIFIGLWSTPWCSDDEDADFEEVDIKRLDEAQDRLKLYAAIINS